MKVFSRNMQLVELENIADARGGLVAIEHPKSLPFKMKRIYYLHSCNSSPRGFHAHKELKQLMICVSGKAKIMLEDRERKLEVTLDNPSTGLLIESLTWREIHDMNKDTVLLVIASHEYDESDYIRDYDEFKRAIGKSDD